MFSFSTLNTAKYHCKVAIPFYTPFSSESFRGPDTKCWQGLLIFFLKAIFVGMGY